MKSDEKKMLLNQLLIIAFSVFILMTVYEVLKQILSPDITIWQSHIITIIFSTACATIISFFVLKRYIKLNRKLSDKNLESKHLQTELEATIKKLEKTLSEVKTLSGMLPICASCKKIRDDEGYWNQIESYIEKRTDVGFSHGCCPECLEKLYGKHKWYKRIKKEEIS